MYTRNLTKNIKSYSGRSRTNPSRSFRQSQINRLRTIVANRNRPVLAQVRYRPINRQEVKCMDTTFEVAYQAAWVVDVFPQRVLNCNYNPSFQSLNLVQQGPGLPQRIGNKISMKSLRLRFGLSVANALEDSNAPDVRVMVIYDRQANGNYPAINDVLNSLSQANGLTNPTQANLITTNLNPLNFERFQVIMDKMYAQPSYASSTRSGPTGDGKHEPWFIDEYIKLKGLESSFKDNANPQVVGNINTGNLFILSIGEFPPNTTTWALRGTARLRFHDN